MTWDDRVANVRLHRFTDRQAAFLVTVMLHAGVCVRRQYCAFAGIPHGRKVCDFFESLVARGYATAQPCGHHRARLFHIHHKPLYRAVGEPDNRHRRPTTLPRAIERLMLLDAVLADRDRTWLATEQDKLTYFTLTYRIPRQDLPSLTFRAEDAETVRYFPDKLPIALDTDGRTHVFLYLLTQDLPTDFRGFLERHAELLRALPAWTVRLLVPCHKRDAMRRYEAAFHEQLASPLRPTLVQDLRWYFHARRSRSKDADERFDHAVHAFGAPRFQALYRAWVERGEPVLDATLSTTLADAIARTTGRFECHVLPHQYGHLFPLVGTA
jgi:hypothetical protein